MNRYGVLLVFESVVLDRFLLVRHRDRGWELPGGHVEPGETPLEGARREWREETGLPLALVEEVALHERPDGSRGHLFLGAMRGPAGADGVGGRAPKPDPDSAGDRALPGAVDPRGRIVQQRWVRRLAEVAPLAFAGDPYRELAHAVTRRLGDPWRLPAGETEAAFQARLSEHPEAAPRGDRVRLAPYERAGPQRSPGPPGA